MNELIFVYNAKSGLYNKATDYAHKMISPGTYNCDLCSLTHGNFGAHEVWSDFVKSLKIPVRFLYKNEFTKIYPSISGEFPAVVFVQNSKLKFILTARQINAIDDLKSLINVLKLNLENLSSEL